MSRIEDALRKAQLLRSLIEDKDKAIVPWDMQGQERGINVLIISRDPHMSTIVNNLQSLSEGEIIASDTVVRGMASLFEKRPMEVNEHEVRFAAQMLDALCCNSSAVAAG
ncbi:MAG: hypothetical protein HXX11_20825 [Desulfuromonadales bacterium]|nr:hypothetical protein [Desulfuromonadales bacterium]